jgi:hypothetical protein
MKAEGLVESCERVESGVLRTDWTWGADSEAEVDLREGADARGHLRKIV